MNTFRLTTISAAAAILGISGVCTGATSATPQRTLHRANAAQAAVVSHEAPAKSSSIDAIDTGDAIDGGDDGAVYEYAIPRRLADAGYTLESLAQMSPFASMASELFDPAAQPATGPITFRPAWLAEDKPIPTGNPTIHTGRGDRGFVQIPPWRRGEILYNFSDEIVDLWLDPPDEPTPNEANALQAIPSVSFVFFYIQQVTQQRIKFIAYDERIHTDDGHFLIESNGPEGSCFDVASVGYQANLDGQLFNCCLWNDFGTVVGLTAYIIGIENEHQRRDRDNHVQVNLQNVGPPDIFGIGPADFVIQEFVAQQVGPYDYGSIQHFASFAASINGLPTIEVLPIPARQWLNKNPVVEANLVILYPDIVTATPPSAAYNTQIVEALEAAMGTGGALSDGDIATIYELYGGPGEPYPWVYDALSGCPADVNGDAIMSSADLVLFLEMINQNSIFADLNGDGVANSDDFQIFYAAWTPGYCLIPNGPRPPTGRPVVGVDND